jgi:hypothetical protein
LDISVRDSRRTWTPLAVVALVAIAGLVAYVLMGSETGPGHRSATPPPGAPVVLEQAPWHIQTYGMGGGSKLSKQQRTRLEAQSAPLTRLVKDLHAALFLDPSARKRIVGRLFTSSAARSFLSARPGLLGDAETVKTVWRRGRIGIQADGARRAAGTVAIVARIDRGEDAVRLGYRSDLYFEKTHNRWRVVAFETDQRRLPDQQKKQRDRADKKKGRAREGKEGKSK